MTDIKERLQTWPEKIWLQHGVEHEVPTYQECCQNEAEVTWCRDHIEDTDIEYVRADLYEQLERRVAELTEQCDQLAKEVGELTADDKGMRIMRLLMQQELSAKDMQERAAKTAERCVGCDSVAAAIRSLSPAESVKDKP